MTNPKLFISYSWSNPEHEQWVVDLAEQLVESGIEVILDKWDLKEGHDAIAFMEKMVTDPAIKKVAIICDEIYAQKADNRAGGVGTETQIISREVYEKSSQDKFVAVLSKKDANGKPCLPTYYSSRIYIDLSDQDHYVQEFERLVRWVYDKPLYIKPELGKPPSFITDSSAASLGTTVLFRRALDAIKNGKSYAAGAFDDYCSTLTTNLERFRLTTTDGEFDDAVAQSIEDFLPYRNEFIQIISAISQYSTSDDFIQRIHKLLEDLIPYLTRPEGVSQWRDWDFDNYKFILRELLLYTIVILIKQERFEQTSTLLRQQYYSPQTQRDLGLEDPMVDFTTFCNSIRSLQHRNQRLNLNRASLSADLLRERCTGTGYHLEDLMQADFVAFMRSELNAVSNVMRWWPETLVFRNQANPPFEIFARASSRTYFEKVRPLLDIKSPKDLEPLFEQYQKGTRQLPTWRWNSVDPARLLGYAKLATRP